MSAFDNEKYLHDQTKHILPARARRCLYIEFGGKLIGDFHASRVLPGFDPNVKMRLLQNLASSADIIICVHAGDIERKKIRSDLGITDDNDAMRLIDKLRSRNVKVAGIVITRYNGQLGAMGFKERLEKHGINVYIHREIVGIPIISTTLYRKRALGSISSFLCPTIGGGNDRPEQRQWARAC